MRTLGVAVHVVLWWATASVALGDVRATAIDGRTLEGPWQGIDDQQRVRLGPGEQALKVEDLLRVEWPDELSGRLVQKMPVLVHLIDGSRLYGRILRDDRKTIEIETELIPRLSLSHSEIKAVQFTTRHLPEAADAFAHALNNRRSTEDTLIMLRNEKVVVLHGVTESLSAKEGMFLWRERSIPFQAETTYGVVFAAGVQDPQLPPVMCELQDGSIWTGDLKGADEYYVRLHVAEDLPLSFPIGMVRRLELNSERLIYLDAIEPADYTHRRTGTTRWPFRKNRSVANKPLRIGDEQFDRGIGMHSPSTLTYDVPAGVTRFAAVIGIDEAVGGLGNVVFRVVADEKTLFDSGPVTGRDEPRTIVVELGGARQVQLVVDLGLELDLGDQANWANARFIK